MVGRFACLALLCLGCQEILPLADGDDPPLTDGGVFLDEGVQTDGSTDGSPDGSAGGDPMLLQPLPPPKPGCPADALTVSARLADGGPRAYTRRAPVRIEFEAPGAERIEFRSAIAGNVNRRAASVDFSFAVASDPIWTGRYPFTVLAFDANGCAASAQVEIPIDGDLIIGTRRGGLWYVGSHGRVLGAVRFDRSALTIDGTINISALAVRRDPLQVLIGFDLDDTRDDLPITAPAIVALNPSTGAVTPFAIEDIQGDAIYPSGTFPYHLIWGSGGQIWADGTRDGALQVFHADGRHDRTVVIPDQNSAAVLGFADGDRILATSRWADEVYALRDDVARPLAQVADNNEMRSIMPGWPTDQGDATLLVVTWNGNRPTLAQRFTRLGQLVDRRPLGGFSTQIVISGDDLIARSTTGGLQIFDARGESESLYDYNVFEDETGEDVINLGAMIRLD